MNSMKVKFVVLLLLAGLLSACGSQAANTPTSQPAGNPVAAATQAPATAPAAATDSSGAATQAPAVSGATVSYTTDIQPLLDSRCVNCHGGNKTEKNLSLKSYNDVMAGSENGSVVTPGDAANSPLAQMVVNGKMPKRGPKLTPVEVKLIVDWINQGAKNN